MWLLWLENMHHDSYINFPVKDGEENRCMVQICESPMTSGEMDHESLKILKFHLEIRLILTSN